MSSFYKATCQTIQRTCLTVGSVVILSTLIAPTIASAATIESFDINGELRSDFTTNPIFSGAAFTGTFELDLDGAYDPYGIGTPTYDLTSWDISFTASSGELFQFSQGETDDRATMLLQTFQDTVTINFYEDTGSGNTTNLQVSFKTDYNIETNTNLTELLNGDPKLGTFDTFRSGTAQNLQGSSNIFLSSASFAPITSPVPEASTLAMLGLGSLMVFGLARRNKKSPSVKTA